MTSTLLRVRAACVLAAPFLLVQASAATQSPALDWIWRSPDGRPSTRNEGSVAFDSSRGVAVLFGGFSRTGTFGTSDETWEVRGLTWRLRQPATRPPARAQSGLAYDAARGVSVMFGGASGPPSGSLLGDTWEWNGTDWIQRNPANAPSPRTEHCMAYDPVRNEVVLFGGFVGMMTIVAETWVWDGTNWSQRNPPTSPSPRGGGTLVADPARGVLVMFGGGDPTQVFDETWEWDGTTWTQVMAPNPPPARVEHAMVYHPGRQSMLMQGGTDAGQPQVNFTDTWEYGGVAGTWTPLVTYTTPGNRGYGGAEGWYDRVRDRVVLHGAVTVDDVAILGPLVPTSVRQGGTGCPGTRGVPLLFRGTPYLGNPAFRVNTVNVPSNMPALLLLSATLRPTSPGGCAGLYVDAPAAFLMGSSSAAGTFLQEIAIPWAPALEGLSVFVQSMVADPGSVVQLAVSPYLELTLGD